VLRASSTRRIAISNRRLVSADEHHVAFRYKDYRADHAERWKTMRLTPDEFIRRFLSHVLPRRFHRIRHYGLLANGNRAANVARARELLDVPPPTAQDGPEVRAAADDEDVSAHPCPCCGGRMIIIERFDAPRPFRWRKPVAGIDSS